MNTMKSRIEEHNGQVSINRIRNTRQYVSAVLRSNFGKAQVKKQSAFALAFSKALGE